MPRSARSPSPARGGARSEIAFRSSQDGPTDDELLRAAALAPLAEDGRLAVPLPRGAAGTARSWPGARARARSAPASGSWPRPRPRRPRPCSRARAARCAGLLAQEIHHRVKNNLQTVASLLRLAASGGGDPQRALRDSVGRVLSIAEVHDLLTSTREEDVDGADLVRRLCGMLRGTLAAAEAGPLAPIVLAPERATALALVYCELSANAVEHGGGYGDVDLRRDGAFAS